MNEMVERVALAIWHAREKHMPERVRREAPDELDRATGAWQMIVDQAIAAIERAYTVPDWYFRDLLRMLGLQDDDIHREAVRQWWDRMKKEALK